VCVRPSLPFFLFLTLQGELSPKSFFLVSPPAPAPDDDDGAPRGARTALGRATAAAAASPGGGPTVIQWACCAGGMAAAIRCRDGTVDVVAVYDWSEPIPVVLSSARRALGGAAPTALAVVDGAFTADGRMEVLLGTGARSLVVVDGGDAAVDQELDGVLSSVVLQIAASPAGRYLAFFGEDGVVTVMDMALEAKLLEFKTKAQARPTQLVWCGEDAVVAAWPERGALLIGPFGDYLSLSYGGAGTAGGAEGVEGSALDGAEADLDGGAGACAARRRRRRRRRRVRASASTRLPLAPSPR